MSRNRAFDAAMLQDPRDGEPTTYPVDIHGAMDAEWEYTRTTIERVERAEADLLDARALLASLKAACERYFDASSELVTDATFRNEGQEHEYGDAYNALYELVRPMKAAVLAALSGQPDE